MTVALTATTFYPAETHHHDYGRKNPVRCAHYSASCDRDVRLAQL